MATHTPRIFLAAGEFLRTGEYLVSPDGNFFATLNGEGRFFVYKGTGPGDERELLWHTEPTAEGGEFYALMQNNGNFCIYRGTSPIDNRGWVWSSGVFIDGIAPYFAVLKDDGNFCVYRGTSPDDNRGWLWGTQATDQNPGYLPRPKIPGLTLWNGVPLADGARIRLRTTYRYNIVEGGMPDGSVERSFRDTPLHNFAGITPDDEAIVTAFGPDRLTGCDFTVTTWPQLEGEGIALNNPIQKVILQAPNGRYLNQPERYGGGVFAATATRDDAVVFFLDLSMGSRTVLWVPGYTYGMRDWIERSTIRSPQPHFQGGLYVAYFGTHGEDLRLGKNPFAPTYLKIRQGSWTGSSVLDLFLSSPVRAAKLDRASRTAPAAPASPSPSASRRRRRSGRS